MKTNTRNKIYEYIQGNAPVTIKNIVEVFDISKQAIHIHVMKLFNEDKIYKVWKPPKVYYFANDEIIAHEDSKLIRTDTVIENNFVFFGADWILRYWNEWFELWCKKRNLDIQKESEIYTKTFEKYKKYKNTKWLIDWKVKMRNTFDKVFLDEVYYLDFYSIEKYWKTMLWNLMLYWKQTWEKKLAEKIIEIIKEPIFNVIQNKKIDSFAFIPPSIDRKVQLMSLLRSGLNIKLPELNPIKIFKDTPVPQKSLSKKEDRIINARDTIYIVDRDFKTDTILLIDDAIWSWATLNETAKKIKDLWLAKKVIWLAIVWSYKWFEVINEV